ncbi:MAG: deoxyribodipyrimidine photo-lyase, partial [Pseudomonadota bacterium]
MSAILLWFKRDLRVDDHPALAHAVAMGRPILPVYVAEPAYWHQPDTSGRQWNFTRDCVQDLQTALAQLGQPLIIRTGDVCDAFDHLHQSHPFDHMISHEETGNLWTYGRDRRVAAWARDKGIIWTELPQSGVTRRLGSRDGWARAREQYVRRP